MGEFTDKAKGAAKQAIGEVKQNSRDPDVRADGRADKVEGKLDETKGKVKGAINRI